MNVQPLASEYDCLVIGGGPAGSTVAALVAQAGYSVLVAERETFPRFHVGESLMPETYWVFKRLGVLEQMRDSLFVKKVSVQFVGRSGQASQPFFFDEHDPRECSTTWQVERAAFDKLLLDNAAARGADCREATRVLEVLFDGNRAHGAQLQTSDGRRQSVQAKVVVDASGQQALLANALGLKRIHPQLKKAAVWSYYQGAMRESGKHGGATVILQNRSGQAWFWYIPLSNGVTSVGVVRDRDALLRSGESPAEIFARELADCPALEQRLAGATRTDDFHVAKEFSYDTRQSAGDGWVLVGDAWGFIDPIYSSGVYFALKSGELAADAIVAALADGETTAARLGSWLEGFQQGTSWIRRLVDAYYDEQFSFGRFMRDHPEQLGSLTNLLIGRIFHPQAGEIFAAMDSES